MLDTNLLPPEARKALWYEEQRKLVVFFVILMSGIFLAGFALIVPSYASIEAEESGLNDRLRFEEGVTEKLLVNQSVARIIGVKSEISKVRGYFENSGAGSEFLTDFLGRAGGGILVSYLSVAKDGVVTIQGRAATRRDLLAFEKQLRESSLLQDISFPLSSIVRDKDIDFSIQGKLKQPL